jgi:ketosteroid isomerase-like protein
MIPCPVSNRAAAASAASTAANIAPELRIRRLFEEKDRALCERDRDGVLELYDADVVFFDWKPRVRIQGGRGLRRMWEACLPYLPEFFRIETRDLVVSVAGELAVTHRLFRVAEPAEAHRGWVREIAVLRFGRGRWRIVHEHCSIVADP